MTHGKSTLIYRPTWDIIDPSKMRRYQECPRGFFFEHILGWRKELGNPHLAYGSSLHRAMEILYHGDAGDGDDPRIDFSLDNQYEALVEAVATWDKKAEESGGEIEWNDAKNPSTLEDLINWYCITYRLDPRKYKIKYVELGGSIIIHPGDHTTNGKERILYWNIDLTLEERKTGKIIMLEHKTTGRNTKTFHDKWHYDVQPASYDLVGKIAWGDHFDHLKVNGIVIRKPARGRTPDLLSSDPQKFYNHFDLIRIPIQRRPSQVSTYLAHLNHWYDRLEWDMESLGNHSPSSPFLDAFHPNGSSCGSAWGCKWSPYCHSWDNPLQQAHTPPIGCREEFWDPRKREVVKYTMDLPVIEDPTNVPIGMGIEPKKVNKNEEV